MHTMQRVWSIKLKLFRDNTQNKKFWRYVLFLRLFVSVSLWWTCGFEEQIVFFSFFKTIGRLQAWQRKRMLIAIFEVNIFTDQEKFR